MLLMPYQRQWPRLVVVLLTLMLVIAPLPITIVRATATQVYVGHRSRLSAKVPAKWTVPSDGSADYAGEDGFVLSSVVLGDDLSSACENAAQTSDWYDVSSRMTIDDGVDVCILTGSIHARELRGVVLPHPDPFIVYGETYMFVELIADLAHYPSIRSSISFDPSDVTPRLYAESVLDIIEYRAWYAPDVDRDALRESHLGLLENADSYADVYWFIQDALSMLRSWGDNHSSLIGYDQTLKERTMPGTGMILEGRVVYLVFPDGPAGHAGIQTGDTIVAVDGVSFNGSRWIESVINDRATLTLSRHGVSDPFDVELKRGPYNVYIPPDVKPIDGAGYVELFTTVGADPVEYATDANEGIARLQDEVTCGWIIDLRRNGGGSYTPMVVGAGALLEEGELFTFARRDGEVVGRVEYSGGSISQDGQDITRDFDAVRRAKYVGSDTPVAVLIGPGTASAAELTTVAFIGRPETRLFGETTGGYTIGNNGYMLFDGAQLILAESTYVDRNSGMHIGGVVPDVEVATDWEIYGTADDPVIGRASAWLREQSNCEVATPVP